MNARSHAQTRAPHTHTHTRTHTGILAWQDTSAIRFPTRSKRPKADTPWSSATWHYSPSVCPENSSSVSPTFHARSRHVVSQSRHRHAARATIRASTPPQIPRAASVAALRLILIVGRMSPAKAQILKSQFVVPLYRKCTRALTFENVSKSRRGQLAVRPRCSRVVWTGKFNIISSMVQTRLELWAGRSLILWLQVHIWDRLGHILDI